MKGSLREAGHTVGARGPELGRAGQSGEHVGISEETLRSHRQKLY